MLVRQVALVPPLLGPLASLVQRLQPDRLELIRRVELIVRLKQMGGRVDGVRELARQLSRDKKNVSEDVDALRELGLLSVRPRGPGRAHRIELPGEQIDLHLLDA